jgi:hypothetical protein
VQLRGEPVRQREADTLLRFVRAARPVAATAVTVTEGPDGDQRDQADRLLRHWRNELVPLAALPGVGGRFAQPIREVLAGTVQGLLVLSLAQVCGVTDEEQQVRLVARLVLRDDPPPGWSPSGAAETPPGEARPDPFAKRVPAAKRDIFATPVASATPGAPAAPMTTAAPVVSAADAEGGQGLPGPGDTDPTVARAVDARAVEASPADLSVASPAAVSLADAVPGQGGEPDLADSPEETETWKLVAQRVPVTILRAARELWTIHRLAGQRAEGRLWHRALGSLPAVGIVGATLGERHALSDIATAAYAELGLVPAEPSAAPSVAAWATTAANSVKSTAKGVAAYLPSLPDVRRRPPFGRS